MLDTEGEHRGSLEWRKLEEEDRRNQKDTKNAEHPRARRKRREQRSSDRSHSGDGSSKTTDDKHLNKHPTPYGPFHIPETRVEVTSFTQAQ